jgi:hypothetical protein
VEQPAAGWTPILRTVRAGQRHEQQDLPANLGIDIATRLNIVTSFPSGIEARVEELGRVLQESPLGESELHDGLYVSPVQMMPSCDQTGMPYFHSSTTSGSASLMSLRILAKVSPRQSPSSCCPYLYTAAGNVPFGIATHAR